MEAQASPEFSDYIHAIARRKALLFGIAIPIAVLAILMSLTLPDIYTSSGLVEIDEPSAAQSLSVQAGNGESDYADQYVQNLTGIVLTDANLRKLNELHKLYPDEEESAALKRLRRDINVKIVTTPILDPRTGREREVVDAFTVSYDNKVPEKAQKGATWLVAQFLAEHRRQRQGRATNAAEFYAKEAERVRTHVAQLESKLADFKKANYGQLPELTQVNMTIMDRTEAQIQQNDMQARSLRQDRVFLMAQLEQQRSAGPDAASVRQLEDQYNRMRSTYDDEPSGHDRAAPADRQPEVRHQRRRGHQPAFAAQPEARHAGRGPAALRRGASRHQETAARHRHARNPHEVRRARRRGNVRRHAGGHAAAHADQRHRQPARQHRGAERRVCAPSSPVIEKNVTATPQVEREYANATRDLTIAREKYEQLLNRQMDAEVSESAIVGGRADEFRLVQAPMLPSVPGKPQRLAILLIGLVASVVLALTATVAAEALDPKVRGARDVRELLLVSPLVAIPTIRNSRSRRRNAWRFAAATASG